MVTMTSKRPKRPILVINPNTTVCLWLIVHSKDTMTTITERLRPVGSHVNSWLAIYDRRPETSCRWAQFRCSAFFAFSSSIESDWPVPDKLLILHSAVWSTSSLSIAAMVQVRCWLVDPFAEWAWCGDFGRSLSSWSQEVPLAIWWISSMLLLATSTCWAIATGARCSWPVR